MMINDFEENYKRLNPQQKMAVDTIEGPVMVVAGPGTGKTQILTLRIANILKNTQVNPENILALTYTELATFEMRQRLSEIIGSRAFRVEISTFHGFANYIIKSYPEEFPNLLSAESITEVEQIELMEKLIEEIDLKLLKPFGEPLHYLRDSLSAINDLKKEGVSPQQFGEAVKKEKEDFEKIDDLYHEKGKYSGVMKGKYSDQLKQIQKQEEFLKIFEGYQNALKTQKKYDFNDMLLSVVNVLETNQGLLLMLQEKYQYILVDEHQDTNASQNKLVELLMSFYDNPNLFVVGDEKQAIYRFQGASLENFLYFQKLYPKAKLINLQENYRSHQGILDASSSMILNNVSANILFPDQKLKAQKKEIEKIRIASLSDYYSEYQFVAEDIAKKIEEGTDPSEIAVLSRRNADLVEMSIALQRVGVPFVMADDNDIFADIYIQKLIILLEAIDRFGEAETLIKTMHVDFLGIEPLDIYKILEYSKKENKDFFVVVSKLNKTMAKKIDLENPDAINQFFEKLKKWKVENHNQSFDDLFISVINESGLRVDFLKTESRFQTLQKLTALFEEVKMRIYKNSSFSLKDFLRLLETLKKHNVILKSGVIMTSRKGVRLLTVHRSKGLEFDYVNIINFLDNYWGSGRRHAAKIKLPWDYLGEERKTVAEFEEIEDERRLFYVALTRARKGILISFAKSSVEGREMLPSQFLQEIEESFIEEIETNSFEEEFSTKKDIIFDFKQKKIVDPKEHEYFKKLFFEKGLSATGIDNFLECPWKYFYRNLISLPEEKNKYFIFGTAVHFALDSYIKQRKAKKLDSKYLIQKFSENISKAGLSVKGLKELQDKGAKALTGYFEKVVPSWPDVVESELVIKGIKLTDEICLNGRLDMLEIYPDNRVRIRDFKTGKPKSRSQIEGGKMVGYNYLRQLTFYKILLERGREKKFNISEGVIDFVEPDEKGRFHQEMFLIEDEQVKELEELIKAVAKQIINLDFWDQNCSKKGCAYCQLRNITFGLEA